MAYLLNRGDSPDLRHCRLLHKAVHFPEPEQRNPPHPAHAPDLQFVRRNRFFFGAQSGELVNTLSKAIEEQVLYSVQFNCNSL